MKDGMIVNVKVKVKKEVQPPKCQTQARLSKINKTKIDILDMHMPSCWSLQSRDQSDDTMMMLR